MNFFGNCDICLYSIIIPISISVSMYIDDYNNNYNNNNNNNNEIILYTSGVHRLKTLFYS